MAKSDLPFGSEFSPSQISLPEVLELAEKYAGDDEGLETAVRGLYFAEHDTSEYNQAKLAKNTRLGLIAYGLLDRKTNGLTDLGVRLHGLRKDEAALYREFARHILLSLHGITLVQCVQDIQSAGEKVDLEKLRQWLSERGIHFPRGGKHPSIMRLWLEKAGVFTSGWTVDETVFKAVSGVGSDEVEVLAGFTAEQRLYLKALANLPGDGPYRSNEVAALAASTYGVQFSEKSLPKDVLYPLEKAGYVELERGTKVAGRGSRPAWVKRTAKLVADLVSPLLEQLAKQTGTDLRPLLRKPLKAVLADLKASDKHLRGLALEALAFKLMRLVDLTYVATRLRGTATGGAEVDVIFEGARLVFSRWQVQCKNTARVNLDDVAKEVGLTHLLKSNVIVIVSTGEIGGEARRYANKVMTDSNLCVVMIDGKDLERIEASPALIVDALNREARQAMKLKALEL